MGIKNIKYLLSISLILIISANFIFLYKSLKVDKNLEIHFLDVGQGDAIYIKTPSGADMLVDGGPDKKVLSELSKSKSFLDKKIDIVVSTHADSDHVSGLVDVLKRYEIGLFIEPFQDKDSDVYTELKNILEKKQIKKIYAMYGQKIDLGSNVFVSIIHPKEDSLFYDNNDSSVVMLLEYGDQSVLLTGDATIQSENEYINFLDQKKITILKAGHHGSNTSTGLSLLEKTRPDVTALSVGRENRYGHPSQDVVDRLNKFNSKIYRTDTDGRITFVLDGYNVNKK